jgi:hypothetical protein
MQVEWVSTAALTSRAVWSPHIGRLIVHAVKRPTPFVVRAALLRSELIDKCVPQPRAGHEA